MTGLVLITPGAGYVDQTAAFCMAVIGTPVVYGGLQVKHRMGYDDALDAFGVHGVGGVLGGLLTGLFANDFVSGSPLKRGAFYGRPVQLGLQLSGILAIAAWSFSVSLLILFGMRLVMPLRVTGPPLSAPLPKRARQESPGESAPPHPRAPRALWRT